MTRQERLGRNIRERRKYLGWSQEQLAQKLSVGGAAVSTYEKGTRAISPDVLQEIADAMYTTVNKLWGEDDVIGKERERDTLHGYKLVAASTGEVELLTEEEQRLLDLFVRGLRAERESREADES